MAEDAPTNDELRQWLEDDPYNSILMRRRFPRVVQALLAEREEKNRLLSYLTDESQKAFYAEVLADWRAQQ